MCVGECLGVCVFVFLYMPHIEYENKHSLDMRLELGLG